MRPVISLSETINTCFQNLMKSVGTSVPAVVLNFYPDKQLADIKIAIDGVDAEGNVLKQQPILSVPVFFQGSSNFSIQHEVKAGDEGIAVFSQRCIDNWLSKGSGNPPNMFRFHDFNDAMFLCGLRSSPHRISSFNNDGIGIHKNDGSQKISIKNDGTIEITTTGKANVNGSEFLTGGIINCTAVNTGSLATGAIVAPSGGGGLNIGDPNSGEDVLINGVNMNTHKHTAGTYTTPDGAVSGKSGDLTT